MKTLLNSLVLSLAVFQAAARPCIQFDADFNLYLFGLTSKDLQLGTQDKWSNASPVDVTATGRPPFDGAQTTCYLSQFFNAIYVLNGDNSNPSAVHIYNVASKSWSTQNVGSGGPNPTSLVAILDHDTNVFYALDGGQLSFLDMGSEVTANSSSLSWVQVGNSPYGADYKPTMALAQNHIHFIGVPGVPAGSADIFVIHFSFFQPASQTYNTVNGGQPFPATHGQTASFFKSQGVQEEFAFIPDDGSATYVINVQNNNTVALAAPSDKVASTYAASINALVQLDSSNAVSFLPYTPGDVAQSQAASWTAIKLPVLVAGNGTSSNGTSTSGGSTGSGSGTHSGASPTASGGHNAGVGLKAGALSLGMSGIFVILLTLS